ncbi:hypothetical protein HZA97_06250 [Candidatus Woesearchaeota archaeon]|nr:hypothetical protein [Candidatus Woesearchaeota archaeon]
MKNLALIFALLITFNVVFAARIHGSIYGFDLESVKDVVVSIGPENNQVQVSKEGNYSFEVPLGTYQVIAKKSPDLLAEETITINEEGNYLVDLILFPDLGDEEFILNETNDKELEEETNYYWVFEILAVLIALLAAFVFFRRKKTPREDELKSKVLNIIKKEGNRTTQKDLRKQIPYSEAKISLVVAELEKEGKIKKIKKGRGNILILENG